MQIQDGDGLTRTCDVEDEIVSRQQAVCTGMRRCVADISEYWDGQPTGLVGQIAVVCDGEQGSSEEDTDDLTTTDVQRGDQSNALGHVQCERSNMMKNSACEGGCV